MRPTDSLKLSRPPDRAHMLADLTNLGGEAHATPAAPCEDASHKKKACFVGVRHHGECRTNPWEARCRAGGRKHNLGYFASAVEAARAYDAFARQFGRKLNFPDEQPHDAAPSDAFATAKRALGGAAGRAKLQPLAPRAGAFSLDELSLPRAGFEADGRWRAALDDDGDVTPVEGNDGAKRAKARRADDGLGACGPSAGGAHDDLLELRRPGRRVLDFPSPAHAPSPSAAPAHMGSAIGAGASPHARVPPSAPSWSLPWGGFAHGAPPAHAPCGLPPSGRAGAPRARAPSAPATASAEAMHAASSLLFLSGLVA